MCLCTIAIELGYSPQRKVTERVTNYRFRITLLVHECQWDTVRISHHHQSNQQKIGFHHRGKTRSACQATALDSLVGPCNVSRTRCACPTSTRVANFQFILNRGTNQSDSDAMMEPSTKGILKKYT